MLRLDVYNTTGMVVRLTPTTHLMKISGYRSVTINRLVELSGVDFDEGVVEEEITPHMLSTELKETYPEVCDITKHPVTPAMKELEVRAYEVSWTRPKEVGQRTLFKIEEVADRRKVDAQLDDYVRRGYL